MNAQVLWQKILEQFENYLKKGTLLSISENVEPLFFKDNKLVLLVEDNFIESILNERVSLMREIIFSILNINVNIDIISSIEDIPNKNSFNKNQIKNKLNPNYTFQNYVVGTSNQFAYAACEAVAENPGTKYNPLFLYGDAGLGKTHLMHAIGNKIFDKNPNVKIMYITTEAFMNEMIKAIKGDGSSNEEFRDLYRNVDILLIDDIQFIESKQGTQEEFFHTFNALYSNNKQIIISSDRPPKDIPTLEDRLRSRFEQGLTADIQPPDYETRIAILQKKSQILNKNIPDEVINYVAKNINSNIRELEGAITRITAHADLYKTDEITLDIAKDALKTLLDKTKKEISPFDIKEKVAQYYQIQIEELSDKKRTKQIAYARQVAMYLCKTLIDNITYENIGSQFGGKDHTTVIHAVTKISNDINKSKEIKEKIENIINDLKK